MKNKVFIATSLDGKIADRDGNIDWLESIPNPDQIDMGYTDFMKSIDAIVMGKNTFEKVLSFGIDWPYEKKVFVLSNTLKEVPVSLQGKVEILKGKIDEILEVLHFQKFKNLYIDGAMVIQEFLREEKIDEMIITRFPILLGGDYDLFGTLENEQQFILKTSKVYLNQIVQDHFIKCNSI